MRQLSEALGAIGQDPAVLKAMADNGVEPMRTSREQMAAAIEREATSMGKLIRAKNISVN